MCNIIFLPNSSVVRLIDYTWRCHILHIFLLVNTNTVIRKWSTERSSMKMIIYLS